MMQTNKLEKTISIMCGVSLLGTIISLFYSNWKVSIVLLLTYVVCSDLFLSYKLAQSQITNSVNDLVGNIMNSLNTEK